MEDDGGKEPKSTAKTLIDNQYVLIATLYLLCLASTLTVIWIGKAAIDTTDSWRYGPEDVNRSALEWGLYNLKALGIVGWVNVVGAFGFLAAATFLAIKAVRDRSQLREWNREGYVKRVASIMVPFGLFAFVTGCLVLSLSVYVFGE